MGVPMPQLAAYFSTFVELVGGAALVLGALLPLAGLVLAAVSLGIGFSGGGALAVA